jgi:hypothetical protein
MFSKIIYVTVFVSDQDWPATGQGAGFLHEPFPLPEARRLQRAAGPVPSDRSQGPGIGSPALARQCRRGKSHTRCLTRSAERISGGRAATGRITKTNGGRGAILTKNGQPALTICLAWNEAGLVERCLYHAQSGQTEAPRARPFSIALLYCFTAIAEISIFASSISPATFTVARAGLGLGISRL